MKIQLLQENKIKKTIQTGSDGFTFLVKISNNKSCYPIELAPLDISLDKNFEPTVLHDVGLIEYWEDTDLKLPDAKLKQAIIKFDTDDVANYPDNEPSLSKVTTKYDGKKGILHYTYTNDFESQDYIQFTDHTIVGVDKNKNIVDFWVIGVPNIGI